MKIGLILVLVFAVIFMGFHISLLKTELDDAGQRAAFLERANDALRKDLNRQGRINRDTEQLLSAKEELLSELEQSIMEFDKKMPLSTLDQYIPKPKLNDVKPMIEKLETFLAARQNDTRPAEGEPVE